MFRSQQHHLKKVDVSPKWSLYLSWPWVELKKGKLEEENRPKFDARSTTSPPLGCTQYYTSTSGIFQSYNFDGGAENFIEKMLYSACFRQAEGENKILLVDTISGKENKQIDLDFNVQQPVWPENLEKMLPDICS